MEEEEARRIAEEVEMRKAEAAKAAKAKSDAEKATRPQSDAGEATKARKQMKKKPSEVAKSAGTSGQI